MPKKPIIKKDPSVIEREEREKMLKCWAAIARRDIPRHQRIFTNLHKKQMLDAKRFAEASQREVWIIIIFVFIMYHMLQLVFK